MISLLRSSKLILQIVFFISLNINLAIAEDQAEDIWEDKTEKIKTTLEKVSFCHFRLEVLILLTLG